MTATQLFGVAVGIPVIDGEDRCFFCGGTCGQTFRSIKHVKPTFTDLGNVCGGQYVCGGCVASMDEGATITFHDGTIREKQKIRNYSWVIANGAATAYSKRHREQLRHLCLAPPSPPYVICLADSGQRQILFKSQICRDSQTACVNLEGEPIWCTTSQLKERIDLCQRLIAILGKPALAESIPLIAAIKYGEHRQTVEDLTVWRQVQRQSLSRLALWLAQSQKECSNGNTPIIG